MHSAVVALIMLASVFGGALFGLWLQKVLPDQHLTTETKEVVRLAFALVATISALVLSLLVSSASSSFGRFDDELTQNAARIVMLDRTLAEYGPQTNDIRDSLRTRFARRMELLYATKEGHEKCRRWLGGYHTGAKDRYQAPWTGVRGSRAAGPAGASRRTQ